MNTQKNKKFSTAVSTVRSAISRRMKSNNGTVSSVDLSDVKTSFKGPARGAVIREAFASLVRDEVIKMTKETVYNSTTRHSVAVYKKI